MTLSEYSSEAKGVTLAIKRCGVFPVDGVNMSSSSLLCVIETSPSSSATRCSLLLFRFVTRFVNFLNNERERALTEIFRFFSLLGIISESDRERE